MDKETESVLKDICSKEVNELTTFDIKFLRARRDYLGKNDRKKFAEILDGEVVEQKKEEKPKNKKKEESSTEQTAVEEKKKKDEQPNTETEPAKNETPNQIGSEDDADEDDDEDFDDEDEDDDEAEG